MKIDLTLLRASWHAWIASDTTRAGPYWLQLVWTALFSVALAAVFTVFGFVAWAGEVENWLELPRWGYWFGKNLIVSLVVGFTIHGLFEGIGTLLGGSARIRRFNTSKRVLFFAGVPTLGVLIGAPLGLWLAGAQRMSYFAADDGQRAVVVALVFWTTASFMIYQWFGIKSRAIDAERRHTEAQLRLLQAQIEPHFLFNTLANVNALIEHDAPKARLMLGAFTDYLRAGLTNLRREQAPLADELALAEAYLSVQQARMAERLRFTIDADAAARQAALPPLLLQPLVENAVVHGLEPLVDGGTVEVQASIDRGCLVIEVRDNGRGLAAAGAAPRRGQGVALANVRQRLRSRFGNAASLELLPAEPGTLARLRLPMATE
jgi:signal transduction histidine kinase